MTVAARKVVALGGGHGLSRALAALRTLDIEPTAVVTVADDGGSSGRLREELGVIPPGDLRMALLTLARNRRLADALSHRFQGGALEGHALGNLVLVALAERAGGDFLAALEEAARLLDVAGRVLPASAEPVCLHGRVGGRDVSGQVRLAKAEAPVERVWADPSPSASPGAVEALGRADAVVLGPGSLYTSIIAALLAPELAAALAAVRAPVVYVANVRAQVGETSGMDLAAHVDALYRHVPGLRLDAVVAHDGPLGDAPGRPLAPELDDARVGRLIRADVAARRPDGAPGWGHDPVRLGAALAPLLAG